MLRGGIKRKTGKMMMSRAVAPLGVSVRAAYKCKLVCSWAHSCAGPKTLPSLPFQSMCYLERESLCVSSKMPILPYLFPGSLLSPLIAHRDYL